MAKKLGRPNQGKPIASDYVAIRVFKKDAPLLKTAASSTGKTMAELFSLLVSDYVENRLSIDSAAHVKALKERGK
jgi:hypothetical protein